jgi:hypothetical protein
VVVTQSINRLVIAFAGLVLRQGLDSEGVLHLGSRRQDIVGRVRSLWCA